MKTVQPSPLLILALRADAAVGIGIALLQLALPGYLAKLLSLPASLLTGSALFLLGYAALLLMMARSQRLWRGLVQFIAIGNIGWALGCVLLMATLAPSPLGMAYLALHVVSVLGFASLELMGLARSRPLAGPSLASA